MTDAIAAAQSALGAMGTTMAVAANNVANAATDGYRSKDVRLETGDKGQGVRVADIVPAAGAAARAAETEQAGVAGPGVDLAALSDVDLAEQSVTMMQASRTFEANAAAIRTADDMAGALLDLKV